MLGEDSITRGGDRDRLTDGETQLLRRVAELTAAAGGAKVPSSRVGVPAPAAVAGLARLKVMGLVTVVIQAADGREMVGPTGAGLVRAAADDDPVMAITLRSLVAMGGEAGVDVRAMGESDGTGGDVIDELVRRGYARRFKQDNMSCVVATPEGMAKVCGPASPSKGQPYPDVAPDPDKPGGPVIVREGVVRWLDIDAGGLIAELNVARSADGPDVCGALVSRDPERRHEFARWLEGKRVRITVEVIG